MKSVFFSLVCCFLVGESFLCADDIDVLQSRLREEYVNTTPYSSAGSYLSSQQSDGSWMTLIMAIQVKPPGNPVNTSRA